MSFAIRCVCGKRSDVPAGRAGAQLRCACGRTIEVPPLTELQKAQAAGEVCPAEEQLHRLPHMASADDALPREFFMILATD